MMMMMMMMLLLMTMKIMRCFLHPKGSQTHRHQGEGGRVINCDDDEEDNDDDDNDDDDDDNIDDDAKFSQD